MIVLGLDTASHAMTCEVSVDGNVRYHEVAKDVRSFVVDAPDLVARAMRDAGVQAGEISLYAVNTGPGSWTGIRVGVTFMKTLALAARRPLVGVPTYALACFKRRPGARRLRFAMRLHADYLFVADVTRALPLDELLHRTIPESELAALDEVGADYIWYGPPPVPAQLEQRAIRVPEAGFAPGTLTAVAEQFYEAGGAGSPGDLVPSYGLPFPAHVESKK